MIYKTIWEIIEVQKCRNKDLSANTLLWINIEKKFVPSVANIVWTDLSTYKIVKKWRFACNRMHVWRDRVLPISLSDIEEEFIVSPAYDVFAVKESEWVLSEYLMIRFLRKEFDKEARFYTDWDVRGWLPWESFCNIKIPVPSEEEQRKIIKRFNVIQNRIDNNNSIIQKLEETAQTLYKHRFVDFEFPTLQNNSYVKYKSSWGEMEYNNLLDWNIPKWWNVKPLNTVCPILTGKEDANFSTENWKYKFFTCAQTSSKCDIPAFEWNAVLLAWNWDFNVKYYCWKFNAYQRTYVLIPYENKNVWTIYTVLSEMVDWLKKKLIWSTIKFITKWDFENTPIIEPDDSKLLTPLNKTIELIAKKKEENEKLYEISNFYISKIY